MENKTFNDHIIECAARCMALQGYAASQQEAFKWLEGRKATPCFTPVDGSFSSRSHVMTLTRLCKHAYDVLCARRAGYEYELPRRVKAYYLPRFEKMIEKVEA